MKKYLIYTLFFFIVNANNSYGQQTIGLFLNDSLSFNGYTLWSSGNSAYLIDNCGFQINRWDSKSRPGLSSYLLENGNLLRTASINGSFNGAGSGGRLEEFDWEGNLVWQFDASTDEYQQHHDIEPLPNGNVLVIAWERKSISESLSAGANTTDTYWPGVIYEFEKIGSDSANIVWEWHIWDHLIQDADSSKNNFGVIKDHPELMDINYRPPSSNVFGGGDWIHFNAIDYNAERDEIILSARNMDEIYIIDHSTTTQEAQGHQGGNSGKGGDFLYRWGNPEAYKRGTAAETQFFGQHDSKIIPAGYPDEGGITVFNNGDGRPGPEYSSVDLIFPPLDSNGNYFLKADSTFGPDIIDWTYVNNPPSDLHSDIMSGAQRLPNGNTLICEAIEGRFFEIDPSNTIVWDYQNTAGNGGPLEQGSPRRERTFRAERYAPDFPGFDGKELIPGDPVELNPLPSDCIIFGESTTSITNVGRLENILLINNLSNQSIQIENQSTETLTIKLIDLNGRILSNARLLNGDTTFDLAYYPPGMYVIFITNVDNSQFLTSKIIKY